MAESLREAELGEIRSHAGLMAGKRRVYDLVLRLLEEHRVMREVLTAHPVLLDLTTEEEVPSDPCKLCKGKGKVRTIRNRKLVPIDCPGCEGSGKAKRS